MQLVLAGVAVVLLALTVPGTLVPTASACPDLARAPSSRWQVTVDQGVAWLVTPCGDRFFSLGVNVVDGGADDERPSYTWAPSLPGSDSLLGGDAGAADRLGIQHARRLLGPGPGPQTPRHLRTWGWARAAGFHWIDPFHPDMGDAMKAWAAYLVGPYRGNPLRIGYFSDNEVGWWNGTLYSFYIQKPPGNHTKQRLVSLLREHYGGDWRRFTDDFVVESLGSFDELLRQRGACSKAASGRRWDSGGAAVDGSGRGPLLPARPRCPACGRSRGLDPRATVCPSTTIPSPSRR